MLAPHLPINHPPDDHVPPTRPHPQSTPLFTRKSNSDYHHQDGPRIEFCLDIPLPVPLQPPTRHNFLFEPLFRTIEFPAIEQGHANQAALSRLFAAAYLARLIITAHGLRPRCKWHVLNAWQLVARERAAFSGRKRVICLTGAVYETALSLDPFARPLGVGKRLSLM